MKVKNKILLILLMLIIIGIIKNPELSLASAKEGLALWFNILLPSLLPFLILSDLLISLGFVQIIGKFLEPLMRPLFNVSGAGAFPFTISLISGYPVGAKLASKLRENNIISKTEGDRLISFSSTSGPLFILGAVLIGMLNSPNLSLLMTLPHYLGSLTLGLIFRYYKNKSKKEIYNSRPILKNIMEDKQLINIKDKPIGLLISNSVKDSMESMLLIGGYLIIYSVIIEQIISSKTFNYSIYTISEYLPINPDTLKGLLAGFIELTTGCKKIALSNTSLINKILMINFLIGWGGLSIHSQALSFISKTDISSKIYFFSKFSHGVFSSIYTYLIYLIGYRHKIMPTVFLPSYNVELFDFSTWILRFIDATKLSFSICIFLMLFSIFTFQVLTDK